MVRAGNEHDRTGGATEGPAIRLPQKRNAWPLFVLLALALLLPIGVLVGTHAMGSATGEAQFEALFSESASERAAAHDYWAVSFRGSPPRLYKSTLVEDQLNPRMRTAPPDAVSEFHRYFSQDPDYIFSFRPVAARALSLQSDRAISFDAARALVAETSLTLRQERAELAQTGPTLNADDHANLRAALRSLSDHIVTADDTVTQELRTSATTELIDAALLLDRETASELLERIAATGSVGEDALGRLRSVIDAGPDALPPDNAVR